MRVKDIEIRENKKEEILEVTKTMIIKHGIANVSMRKIAKELNQVQGTIYHYFKNKEEILIALTRKEYLEIIKKISQPVEGNIEEKMSITLTRYMELMIEKYPVFNVLNHIENKGIQEQMFLLTTKIADSRSSIKNLCELLEKGNEEKIFSISNIELRAQVIISATQGVIQRIAIEKPKNQKEIIEEHITMIVTSIRRKENA